MPLIQIGQILKPHGFKGSCLATSSAGKDSAFAYLKTVFVGQSEETAIPLQLQGADWMPKGWKLTFAEIDSEEKLKTFKNALVFASRQDLRPLNENEFYIADLEGLAAWDITSQKAVGTFLYAEQVCTNQARWWFKNALGEEFSIPNQKRYIKKIDMDQKRIWLDLADFDLADES